VRKVALIAVWCLALSGCRGSGASGMVPPVSSGTASFSVSVPPANGAPPAMQSLVVALQSVDGKPPAAMVPPFKMNLSKATPGCSLLVDGSLVCTAKLAVPAGNDAFTVTAFKLPNQTGARVYSNNVTTRISAGRSTTCVKRT